MYFPFGRRPVFYVFTNCLSTDVSTDCVVIKKLISCNKAEIIMKPYIRFKCVLGYFVPIFYLMQELSFFKTLVGMIWYQMFIKNEAILEKNILCGSNGWKWRHQLSNTPDQDSWKYKPKNLAIHNHFLVPIVQGTLVWACTITYSVVWCQTTVCDLFLDHHHGYEYFDKNV